MSEFLVDLLAVGAHPDDVELFCGGTLIRLADLGRSTGVIDLTRGELASRGDLEQRAAETAAASRVLGLRFRENLGLPDTAIDPHSRTQLLTVVEAIRRHRPEILLIPWIEERHPDHAAAGELLRRAAYFAGVRRVATDPPGERFVPRQLLHYAMRYRMRSSLVVDTSAAAARKMLAIGCYSSQVTRLAPGDETLLSSSGALAAIEARDRYYGSLIGTSHGEPLRCVGALGIVDLVRQFRDNPFNEPHLFEAEP